MIAKLSVLATVLAVANAGFLSLGYDGNVGTPISNGPASGNNGNAFVGDNGGGGFSSRSFMNSFYNNAPLNLNHGSLPSTSQQSVVAPLRYAPRPASLASSTSFRHQTSISQSVPVPVAITSIAGNGVGIGSGPLGSSGNGYTTNGRSSGSIYGVH